MNNFIHSLHDFIIDQIFQPIADFVQVQTGKTSFWITAQLALIWFTFCLLAVSVNYINNGFQAAFFGLLFMPFLFYIAYRTFHQARINEERYQNAKFGTLNITRFTEPVWRIFMLFIMCAVIYQNIVMMFTSGEYLYYTLSSIEGVFFVLFHFFEACTPKPPSFKREYQTVPQTT